MMTMTTMTMMKFCQPRSGHTPIPIAAQLGLSTNLHENMHPHRDDDAHCDDAHDADAHYDDAHRDVDAHCDDEHEARGGGGDDAEDVYADADDDGNDDCDNVAHAGDDDYENRHLANVRIMVEGKNPFRLVV